ncbi:DUF938 domain-containing protein [Vibrio sp. VB16]|uniref:DUF938 domain-containing protein n=1 Tax=Vibrio sp. VB16 TaxID=2785746 RepID=UPI001E65CADF|nr:DUF938 domain-containing protein [Vibrio sp. VB16]UGA56312.1 class I SAM-dependent methyltransferase [Vibrio sp. VB16]
MSKCFSPSFERNKQVIFEQLSIYFKNSQNVLEIGSGTGQHAVFLAPKISNLNCWYTSDMPENHLSINAWVSESGSDIISNPFTLKIGQDSWPNIEIDAVFTANTTHIMQQKDAQLMMRMIAKNLPKGGVFCQYGPMMVNGEHTSSTNQEFDKSLTKKGFGGIRDIEDLVSWAKGMELVTKIPMPANNFMLVWTK